MDCRTPWSYSYAGTSERRYWSLISQSGKRSKDYFHEDGLIGPLNYSNCMFGPPVLLWVMSISSYPVRRSRSFSENSHWPVFKRSYWQCHAAEFKWKKFILSTLSMNSILESPCFPSSDYECRMGKWLMSVRKIIFLLDRFLFSVKWKSDYFGIDVIHTLDCTFVRSMNTGIILNFRQFWKSRKSLPVHIFLKNSWLCKLIYISVSVKDSGSQSYLWALLQWMAVI